MYVCAHWATAMRSIDCIIHCRLCVIGNRSKLFNYYYVFREAARGMDKKNTNYSRSRLFVHMFDTANLRMVCLCWIGRGGGVEGNREVLDLEQTINEYRWIAREPTKMNTISLNTEARPATMKLTSSCSRWNFSFLRMASWTFNCIRGRVFVRRPKFSVGVRNGREGGVFTGGGRL